MPPFVGRAKEMGLLRKALTSPGGEMIPIYGRRRVGKSAMIVELLREHPGLYLVGKQAPEDLQLRELLERSDLVALVPRLGPRHLLRVRRLELLERVFVRGAALRRRR